MMAWQAAVAIRQKPTLLSSVRKSFIFLPALSWVTPPTGLSTTGPPRFRNRPGFETSEAPEDVSGEAVGHRFAKPSVLASPCPEPRFYQKLSCGLASQDASLVRVFPP